jgi:spermidine/putrescine-binding protein
MPPAAKDRESLDMSIASTIRRPLAGAATRRDMLRAASALGLGVAAIGIAGGARAAGTVSYLTWAGYDAPEMHKAFSDKRGGPPDSTIFASEAEALQKVLAGFTPDVSHPCIYDIVRWRDAGVIRPIDTARLTNWGGVFDELKAVPGANVDGEQWFIPFDWGNGSILYRTDLVEVTEDSWSLLFDKKYAGKLAMWGAIDGAVNAAALVAGAKDPFNMTAAEMAKVRTLLIEQRELLRFYWDDPAAAEQALASGEIVAAYTWNQSLVNLQNQGLPVRYMRPKEGILTWVCGLVAGKELPAGEDAVYDFLDAMLDPATGAFLFNSYGYGHSNRITFNGLDKAKLATYGIADNPAEMFKGSVVLHAMDPKVRESYTKMFEEIRAGAS